MSKFKAGDWGWCGLAKPGETMHKSGFYIHDVLPNGGYVVETNPGSYRIWSGVHLNGASLAEGCTGWDYVMPDPKFETWVEWLCVNDNGGIIRWFREDKTPSSTHDWFEKTGRTITREVKT